MLRILILFAIFSARTSFAMEEVCFSPSPCCESNIIHLISNAQSVVRLAVQHISSSDIFEALVKAKDRGVNVFIITDSRSYRLKTSLVYALQGYGVDVRMPSTHSETNKFAIFDDAIVFTGSYSWTDEASTHHSGNCVVLHEDLMVSKYVERFGMLWNSYE